MVSCSTSPSCGALSRELAASRKLESVGRLAAGVAHEINTPVQYGTDNTQFMRPAIADVTAVVHAYRELRRAMDSCGDTGTAARVAADAEEAADFDYIMDNIPRAIDGSLEGLGRITTIVRSMKEFAHPDQATKTLADLDQPGHSLLHKTADRSTQPSSEHRVACGLIRRLTLLPRR